MDMTNRKDLAYQYSTVNNNMRLNLSQALSQAMQPQSNSSASGPPEAPESKIVNNLNIDNFLEESNRLSKRIQGLSRDRGDIDHTKVDYIRSIEMDRQELKRAAYTNPEYQRVELDRLRKKYGHPLSSDGGSPRSNDYNAESPQSPTASQSQQPFAQVPSAFLNNPYLSQNNNDSLNRISQEGLTITNFVKSQEQFLLREQESLLPQRSSMSTKQSQGQFQVMMDVEGSPIQTQNLRNSANPNQQVVQFESQIESQMIYDGTSQSPKHAHSSRHGHHRHRSSRTHHHSGSRESRNRHSYSTNNNRKSLSKSRDRDRTRDRDRRSKFKSSESQENNDSANDIDSILPNLENLKIGQLSLRNSTNVLKNLLEADSMEADKFLETLQKEHANEFRKGFFGSSENEKGDLEMGENGNAKSQTGSASAAEVVTVSQDLDNVNNLNPVTQFSQQEPPQQLPPALNSKDSAHTMTSGSGSQFTAYTFQDNGVHIRTETPNFGQPVQGQQYESYSQTYSTINRNPNYGPLNNDIGINCKLSKAPPTSNSSMMSTTRIPPPNTKLPSKKLRNQVTEALSMLQETAFLLTEEGQEEVARNNTRGGRRPMRGRR